MNKYVARVKEFAKDHDLAIAVVATVVSIVMVEEIRRKRDLADACLGSGGHIYLKGDDAKFVEDGNVVLFGDRVVMSKDAWEKLRDK